YQWLTFGGPLKTGYDYWAPGRQRFAWTNAVGWTARDTVPLFADALHGKLLRRVCPCPPGGAQAAFPSFLFYPLVLAGLFWVFSPPMVSVIGGVYLWRHRREPPAAFASWVIVSALALQLFFFYQEIGRAHV